MNKISSLEPTLGSLLNKYYSFFIIAFFFIYLFFVMSFGRLFSIIRIEYKGFSVYITEMFLLLSLPYVLINVKKLMNGRLIVLVPLGLFVLLASVYFVGGFFMGHSKLVLRDVVLCGYPLLFVLTFLICLDLKNLERFCKVVILAVIPSIFFARCLIFLESSPYDSFSAFAILQMKAFNFGLYFGIMLSFLVAFAEIRAKGWMSVVFYVLISLLLYMLFILGVRTLWLAVIIFFIVMFFLKRSRFVLPFVKIAIVSIVLFPVLYARDIKNNGNQKQNNIITGKLIAVKESVSIVTSHNAALGMDLRDRFSKSENGKQLIGQNDKSKNIFELQIEKFKELRKNSSKTQQREHLDSLWWRYLTWRDAILFGLKAPLLGQGFGVYPEYQNWDAVMKRELGGEPAIIPPHNDLITVFFKMGFVGLALYLVFNIMVFIDGIKYFRIGEDGFLRDFLLALLLSFIFWHVIAFFYDAVDSPPTNVFLWIIIGLIEACIFHIKQKNKQIVI